MIHRRRRTYGCLCGWRQVFLNATTSKKQAMHTRLRGVELWMKRKNLPRSFRQRVRQYERQRWAATRGVDECRIVRDLPEGLRRDIKYHLCLDLVRQVRAAKRLPAVLDPRCDEFCPYWRVTCCSSRCRCRCSSTWTTWCLRTSATGSSPSYSPKEKS